MKEKYPNPLNFNSTIGLVCPAGGFDDYKPIRRTVKYLKGLGFNVKLGKHILVSNNYFKYLSGKDNDRLSDLNNFLFDSEIDAVFCMRGGFGTSRILKELDYKKILKHKKIILGYSDITALLLAIYSKTGLITFHGPMFGTKFLDQSMNPKDKKSAKCLWNILTDSKFKFSYINETNGHTLKKGTAEGILIGGNLTIICSLLGSEFLPDFKNKILFIEDCYESPYKIDRLLTQLDNADVFSAVKGVIFSDFYKCGYSSNEEIIKLFKEKIIKYNIPTIYKFPIGHSKKNYTVPIGQKVFFDANKFILQSI